MLNTVTLSTVVGLSSISLRTIEGIQHLFSFSSPFFPYLPFPNSIRLMGSGAPSYSPDRKSIFGIFSYHETFLLQWLWFLWGIGVYARRTTDKYLLPPRISVSICFIVFVLVSWSIINRVGRLYSCPGLPPPHHWPLSSIYEFTHYDHMLS